MNVQFIENKGQAEYAVIPVEDYHVLLSKAENHDDIIAFDQAISSDEETIPGAVVSRLINGDNKIKVWREYRAMTQAVLAKKTGLAQSYIGQIETNKRIGTVIVIKAIAESLAVDIDDLV